MSDKTVTVSASPFWAVALILIWLNGCEDGKRVMNAIDPPHTVAATPTPQEVVAH